MADEHADALLHLARRLVGEGHRKDLRREGAAGRKDVGDAGRQHAGLAGAGTGKHEHGTVKRFDRLGLFRVEAGEIIRARLGAIARSHGARGNTAGGGDTSGGWRLLARRRLLVEERNVVETTHHAAQCSDSVGKGQKGCSSFIPFSAPAAPSLWKDRRFRDRLFLVARFDLSHVVSQNRCALLRDMLYPAVLSKTVSIGTCSAVASWLVRAASEITRKRSACSASLRPFALAAAVWEWAQ
ncbi:hypothetical protein D9M68_334750 [compost metagenome]